MSWFYHPYPLGEEATSFVATPIRVTLANRANRQGSYDTRRRAMARYTRPVVSAPFPPQGGVLIQYVQPPRAARKTMARLEPPTVVNQPAAPFVASPVRVELARIRPQRTQYRLGPPVVVFVIPLNYGPGVRLATSSRGRAKSKLAPPTVVTAVSTATFVGPEVKLARSTRPATRSRLDPPAVTFGAVTYGGPGVRLAPSSRGRAKSRLAPPVVVNPEATDTFYGPKVELARIRPVRTLARLLPVPAAFQPVGSVAVTLAYSSRGKPRSFLRPMGGPAVVYAPIRVTLVRNKPQPTTTFLRAPADTVGLEDQGRVSTTLAYSRRGRPRSRLAPPVVIDLRPQTYFIAVELAPSFRGKPTSFLGAPTDLSDAQDIGQLKTHLAYSRRGAPKSKLRAPVVVAPVLARAIGTSLAYSLRGKAKPELRPPVVVDAFRIPVVSVTLAPSSRGIPKSRLSPPTDLVDAADLGTVEITLAPSRYPHPKSRLGPPTVVAPVLARPILTQLARITPAPTVAVLREPVVIDLRPQTYFVATTLVRITPPPTTSKLRPPTATLVPGYPVDLQAEIQLVRITPPPTMSILRKPVVVAPVLARAIATHLAYSRRGKPKSILRPPRVIDVRPQTRFLAVTLAPSRRPVAKSKLTRVIVPRFQAPPPVAVTLTRIRPPRTSAFYTGVVVGGRAFAPIAVTLAPSSRLARTPHSRLYAPTVLREFVATPIRVSLAPQARRPGEAVLSPPAAIGDNERFFGPAVTLAPSSRGRTLIVRIAPDGSARPPCYGVATGSTAPSAENALETDPGAETTSTITAGAEAASSTAAASTIQGTTAPGAENDISDAQREGC